MPLTVRLHHACSHVINSPTKPLEHSSNSSAAASVITASPLAALNPLPKLINLFKLIIVSCCSRATPATVQVAAMAEATAAEDEATAAEDELTTALTALVKAGFLHIVDIRGQPEFHEILPHLLHSLALNSDLDFPYTVVYTELVVAEIIHTTYPVHASLNPQSEKSFNVPCRQVTTISQQQFLLAPTVTTTVKMQM